MLKYEVLPVIRDERPQNPCQPSPCGPNSECRVSGDSPSCSCLPEFVGAPPNCRPECISNSECPTNQACINQKCVDPCPGLCGQNAICRVFSHSAMCLCDGGFTGDPFSQCSPIRDSPPEVLQPCNPSPCGVNAKCEERGGAGSCQCLPDYFGNPYDGCRPECVLNSDCPSNQACVNQKCRDPCPGTCGQNAECQVVNHLATCNCLVGYTGDPYSICRITVNEPRKIDFLLHKNTVTIDGLLLAERVYVNPCQPSPCGPNSQCREVNEQGVCSCLPEFIGSPPACRPECTSSSECAADKACVNRKCVDPCPNVCGQQAECRVRNHNPICTCLSGFTGDPFTRCYRQPRKKPVTNRIGPFDTIKLKLISAPPPVVEREPLDPCVPSPCGANSQCREIHGTPSCSCLPQYLGTPPNCRPECSINAECPSHQACINQKCRDPCPGSCGLNTQCSVINHTPICSCLAGYIGDPFSVCNPEPIPEKSKMHYPPRLKFKNHNIHFNKSVRDPLPPEDPCNPSPCGSNTQCNNGVCSCLPEYHGDPYTGCRPECVLHTDCDRSRACVRHKCVDPCPGTCGTNAICEVLNHIPNCRCLEGMQGNAFIQCSPVPSKKILTEVPIPSYHKLTNLTELDVVQNPCQPSPCGPNSQCRVVNQQAICSCITSFIGSPPFCRPECTTNSECPLNLACRNQKCSDPCPGVCGRGAQCHVTNHSPFCRCLERYTGNPFVSCQQIIEPPVPPPRQTCLPSPCGPYSQCREVNESPSCTCLPEYIGAPPNCRPECVTSSECPTNQACIQQKCRDPCPGLCGQSAECRVLSHTPSCVCPEGMEGDPFTLCKEKRIQELDQLDPCSPSPCGINARCTSRQDAGSCQCLPDYFGNPYEGCRPECVLNSDCPSNKACQQQKCQDPCPGTCGQNALCNVLNHIPSCSCISGYSGDPYRSCVPERKTNFQIKTNFVIFHGLPTLIAVKEYVNPCQPSPCGPNSQCREVNEQAICSCLPEYVGAPPVCRPECTISSECPADKACVNQKCVDPCPNTCGDQAICRVVNHSPICSCRAGYTGDAFFRCFPKPRKSCHSQMVGSSPNCFHISKAVPPTPVQKTPVDPCVPTPCGPYSQCRSQGDAPACSCLVGYIGAPPNCRPECRINAECPSSQACINEKCRDPCPGSCGYGAICNVINHTPSCTCPPGYSGDPFSQCQPVPPPPPTRKTQYEPKSVTWTQTIPPSSAVKLDDPCNPSPCGPNAQCNNGVCTCIPEYHGDPYSGCRPECITSADCSRELACSRNKCFDPCPGTCAPNAICTVLNHVPMCTCPEGYNGNAFVQCKPTPRKYFPSRPCSKPNDTQLNDFLPAPALVQPCQPSPCGPNSQCREVNQQAVCSCVPGYIGTPPLCRPECTSNSECLSHLACVNQKCNDPCPGSCGRNAQCSVVNHNPFCTCLPRFTGNPFVGCQQIIEPPRQDIVPQDPCRPSPCGPNSECRAVGETPTCTCLGDFVGSPPYCKPECVANSECPSNLACINQKCRDPCPGLCGSSATCRVVSHTAMCICDAGLTGDPFTQCQPIVQDVEIINPCQPSPCGANAECIQRNGAGACQCLTDYFGNPYEGCRPECVLNSDCPSNRACQQQKCRDPCPGSCGQNAECNVVNHTPMCNCFAGFIGDPYRYCSQPPERKRVPIIHVVVLMAVVVDVVTNSKHCFVLYS